MELLEYLHILRKRIWVIVAITLAAALISGIVSIFVIHPTYEAKVTMIVTKTSNNVKEKVEYSDILMYQQLVKTYAELAKSKLVAEKTIAELKYDMKPEILQKNLTIVPKNSTQVLELAIQDKDAERTMMLANTLSNVFVNSVKEMMSSDDVKIMDKADIPLEPVKPKVLLNIVIAAFLGLMSSLGLVFLMEYLDSTVKTERDIEKYIAVTVLASIPYVDDKEI